MICNKCMEEIEDNKKFCPKCGNKLIVDGDESYIIFEREKQFYGVAVPISIYLDGNLVGKLKSNSSIKVNTTVGSHRLAFNLWSGNGQYDINIDKDSNGVKVVFKLKMGLLTSKPKIISIENIKFKDEKINDKI